MAVNKRYYWLKLDEGFFRQKEIKRLRKIAGGDTYTIIYLKMLLNSLKSNGILYFDSVESDFVAELALDIDEDEENVAITVQYLMTQGILVELNEEEYLLSTCEEMVGSETASTRRSRKSRKEAENRKKALQCNTDATICNGEKEKEIEIELETEIREIVSCQQIADLYNATCVSFPHLKTLSDTRKKAIKARLKVYKLEDFRTLFAKAEASSFLKGANDRNWSANFDWLIKDSNMAKVLDGNYDDRPRQPKPTKGRREPVPNWMAKERQDYDMAALESELVANSPELSQKAEDLRKRLQGGEASEKEE